MIVLSARQNEVDKVSALRLGADDYVTKPFGVAELLARIDAVLRRMTTSATPNGEGVGSDTLGFGDVSVNLSSREVFRGGKLVAVTHLEFELLVFLIRHPDQVFTRDQLLNRVVGVDAVVIDRNIDVHIRAIRKKLGSHRDLIETQRGVGYRFTE